MKFKVGDKVRLTRETLLRMRHDGLSLLGPSEFVVVKVYGDKVFYEDVDLLYIRDGCLELVPEEPEFEYGEEVEVSDNGEEWEKRIYLATVGIERKLHICVSDKSIERYKSGLTYNAASWEYVRKLRPQLTRKEIAEKFGVSEDFTF